MCADGEGFVHKLWDCVLSVQTPSCDLCWSAPAWLCSSLAAECCLVRILEQSNGVLDCVNKLDQCSGVAGGGLGQPGTSGKTQW